MSEPAFPSRREMVMLAALTAGHLLWTVLCFTAADWLDQLTYRFSDYVECAYAICIGSVAAQLVLLATWTALGPGSHLARVSGSMLLMFVTGYALALYTDGFYSGDTSYGHNTIFILFALIVFFVLQLPFWLFRFMWGWRVVFSNKGGPLAAAPTRRLSILHLLGWTMFIATLLAMTQAFSHFVNGTEGLLDIGAMAAIGVAVQLVVLWTVLSPEPRTKFTKAAILLVVCGCATAGVYIYFGLSISMGFAFKRMLFGFLGVSYCTLLVVTLLIVRACGFRLAMASGERQIPDSA